MNEQKKTSGPGAIGAGVLAFIITAIGAVFVTRDRDDRKPTPRTDTAVESPATTASVEPDPGTTTAPPEPAIEDPRPDPDLERIPDEQSSKPGRRRVVVPAKVCSADDVARAQRYAREPGYAWLAERCDLIAEWRPTGRDIVVWLADEGYDSPAADCDFRVFADRRIRPGDGVAMKLDERGALRYVWRVHDWTPIGGMMLARVIEQSPNAWLVTSYGERKLIPLDGGSSVLDHEGWNSLVKQVRGEPYFTMVDPSAPEVSGVVTVPCYSDALAAPVAWAYSVSKALR
jgi:hypothetical protein